VLDTTGDLINFVLRASGINGVGQSPMAEDSNTGLDFLRMLIAQWNRKRWLVWNEVETAKVATGANSYTIGPGGDFSVARPDKIHAAWVRFPPFQGPNAVDIPLTIIQAKEDWARTTIKDLQSLPTHVFYDSAWPMGVIYFHPVPPGGHYEMHLVLKATMPVYTTLTDPLNLPDEYIEALVWSLCVRMQMAYGLPSRPDHAAAMRQAVNVVMMANTQIGLLKMPNFSRGTSDVSNWMGGGTGVGLHPFILNVDVLNGQAVL
jgi:hypothetical protein